MAKKTLKNKHLEKGCKKRSKNSCEFRDDFNLNCEVLLFIERPTVRKKNKLIKSVVTGLKITGKLIWKLLKSKIL